ncbi:Double-stranded RNA-binding [Artemisia annua]|uniref:Double-stranded RNA-binding n=1 Tax=Artemisia annua TaxID=35608 RepID=A0A2U1PVL5_ARTAN|nr:Double-stranded RNA-binding [Artemisia annua]
MAAQFVEGAERDHLASPPPPPPAAQAFPMPNGQEQTDIVYITAQQAGPINNNYMPEGSGAMGPVGDVAHPDCGCDFLEKRVGEGAKAIHVPVIFYIRKNNSGVGMDELKLKVLLRFLSGSNAKIYISKEWSSGGKFPAVGAAPYIHVGHFKAHHEIAPAVAIRNAIHVSIAHPLPMPHMGIVQPNQLPPQFRDKTFVFLTLEEHQQRDQRYMVVFISFGWNLFAKFLSYRYPGKKRHMETAFGIQMDA